MAYRWSYRRRSEKIIGLNNLGREILFSRFIIQNVSKTLITFTQRKKLQLQKKFKHAKDFGVSGNYNKANSERFKHAIEKHVATASRVYLSKYRGQEIYVYLKGRTAVYTDLKGNFISGWRLTYSQTKYHLRNGTRLK